MNPIAYRFYSSRLWSLILRLFGKVPCGPFMGWRRWMSLENAQKCVGPGWGGLVATLFGYCLRHGIRIHQIKEKFGGLRFYVGGSTPELDLMIDGAEAASLRTCEECGRAGEPRGEGWVKTLCDEHVDRKGMRGRLRAQWEETE